MIASIGTPRLLLRPLEAADAPALHRLVNDYSVAGNLARVPFPYSRAQAEAWIASTHRQAEAGEGFHFAITEAGALVGCAGLTLGRQEAAELGYWIGRAHWGRGLAREAAAALLGWAERERGITRFAASALADNHASHAVLRALGFTEAGQAMQPYLSRNRTMPVRLFRREAAAQRPAPAAPTPAAAPAAAPLPLLLVVACALVDADGRVLLAQRPQGKAMAGLWEFPGGKVAPGESPEAALIRELKEELDIDVSIACLAPLSFASHAYERFHLLMPLFVCRRWGGTLRAREGQALAWVRPQRLRDYPMPPADEPLIAILQEML